MPRPALKVLAIAATLAALAGLVFWLLLADPDRGAEASRAASPPSSDPRPAALERDAPAAGAPPPSPAARPPGPAVVAGGFIAGRVVDDRGNPIAGASIAVDALAEAPEGRLALTRVPSDASGGFVVTGLEPGRHDVAVEAAGYSPAGAVVVVEAAGADAGTLVLHAATERLGRVLDSTDAPVSGAEVTVRYVRVFPKGRVTTVHRMTGAGGTFAFARPANPVCESIEFHAKKEGVGEGSMKTIWSEGISPKYTIRLKPGGLAPAEPVAWSRPAPFGGGPQAGTVEGVVVDPAGNPLEGLIVSWAPRYARTAEATTDAAGQFRLADVQPMRDCRVCARRGRGPVTWSPRFELAEGATVTGIQIMMDLKPDYLVRIVGTDGRRVEGVAVTLEQEVDGEVPLTTVRTDANGEAGFKGLVGDRLILTIDRATLPGGTVVDDSFPSLVSLVFADDPPPLVVSLRAAATFRGTIVLEDGTPLEDGAIECVNSVRSGSSMLVQSGKVPEWRPSDPPNRGRTKIARVGPRGAFSVSTASLDDYEVLVITRVVPEPLAIETFVPVGRAILKPGVDNRIVVRRK
jgi:hypothetical protein